MKSLLSLRIAFSLALIALLFNGCAHDGRPTLATSKATPDTETFKVLAWNLEHFTDPFDDPYIDNSREDAGAGKSDRELALLARALEQIDADVLALQEVESDRAVKFFLDSYLPDHDYQFFACVPSTNWYQNVVVASRFPIGRIISLREVMMYNEVLDESRNRYNNRLMFAEIQPSEDYEFLLGCFHLKAGGDPEDPVWREQQIALVKDTLAEITAGHPAANVALAGDLNLVPSSGEYESLVSPPLPFVDPLAGQGTSFTHPSTGPGRRIDYIVFNPAMAPEYVPASAGSAMPLSLDELARISDHLPVVTSFYAEDLDL